MYLKVSFCQSIIVVGYNAFQIIQSKLWLVALHGGPTVSSSLSGQFLAWISCNGGQTSCSKSMQENHALKTSKFKITSKMFHCH